MLMLKSTGVLSDVPDSPSASVPKMILLRKGTTVLGRDRAVCDVYINSRSKLMISRRHATIKADEKKFILTAHGQNGVIINGHKVERVELSNGDEVIFGGAGSRTRVGDKIPHPRSELIYHFVRKPQSTDTADSPEAMDTSNSAAATPQPEPHPTLGLASQEPPPTVHRDRDRVFDSVHEELLCCICQELMVRAHALQCSHSFCKECITNWISSKEGHDTCPNCRKQIVVPPTPVLVVDNTIEKLAPRILSEEELQYRKDRIKKLEQAEGGSGRPSKRSRSETRGAMGEVIEMITIDESDGEDANDTQVWSLEYARAMPHATCRTCHEAFGPGALRWVCRTEQPGAPYPLMHWYHYTCMVPEGFTWTPQSLTGLSAADRARVTATFPQHR